MLPLKNLCLNQPVSDQEVDTLESFVWSQQTCKPVVSETAEKIHRKNSFNNQNFRSVAATNNRYTSESMQTMRLKRKQSQDDDSTSPQKEIFSMPFPHKQIVANEIKKSVKEWNGSNLKFPISSKKSQQNDYFKPILSRKTTLLVETPALLQNDLFKKLNQYFKGTNTICSVEDKRHFDRLMLSLSTYFENLLKKIFVERKSDFLNSDYIKAIFEEEIKAKKEKDQRHVFFQGIEDTPFTLKRGSTNFPQSLRDSVGSIRNQDRDSVKVDLFSPNKLELRGKFNRKIKSSTILDSIDQRKFNLAQASQNLMRARGGHLGDCISKRFVREWKEEILRLKLYSQFRVLVVDDVPEQVTVVCDLISMFPDVVADQAFDGLQAVQMVRRQQEEGYCYHLILTDLIMPHDGYETTKDIRKLEKIKNCEPRNKIFGITADSGNPIIDMQATIAEMNGTLHKPLCFSIIKEIFKKRAEELGLPINFD